MKNDELVEQPRRIRSGVHRDHFGGADHPLEVANAAVVAVFLLLGAFVFEIFTEVAEGTGGLYVRDKLGAQDPNAVVDFLLHLFDVDRR